MISRKKLSTKRLAIIPLLVAAGVVIRIELTQLAYMVPILSTILIKIGLSELLAFISGFVFGPVQGFITGFLTIAISDILSIHGPGLWTPFIATIIGLLGPGGWALHRLSKKPNILALGTSAVILTLMSELLQNLWMGWYMWTFYMPKTPLAIVLGTLLIGGIKVTVTALINNVILFTTVAPRIIKLLQELIMPQTGTK